MSNTRVEGVGIKLCRFIAKACHELSEELQRVRGEHGEVGPWNFVLARQYIEITAVLQTLGQERWNATGPHDTRPTDIEHINCGAELLLEEFDQNNEFSGAASATVVKMITEIVDIESAVANESSSTYERLFINRRNMEWGKFFRSHRADKIFGDTILDRDLTRIKRLSAILDRGYWRDNPGGRLDYPPYRALIGVIRKLGEEERDLLGSIPSDFEQSDIDVDLRRGIRIVQEIVGTERLSETETVAVINSLRGILQMETVLDELSRCETFDHEYQRFFRNGGGAQLDQ